MSAQAKLKVKRPIWPSSVEESKSLTMLEIPELYAVVARPMKRVMRLSIAVTPLFFHLLHSYGFSLSPVANVRIIYSFSSCMTVSVRVRGISMFSTVLIGPQSASMDSFAGSTYFPPTIRPMRG